MKRITLTDEAMDLLFHTFNSGFIEQPLKHGFGRLIGEGDRTSRRPLFGADSLHSEIMGQLINSETVVVHDNNFRTEEDVPSFPKP